MKENTVLEVPAKPVTVTTADTDAAVPATPMHATDVAVVQLLVEQSAVATVAANVAFEGAKSIPVIVTLAIIEATLYGANVVSTGAEEY